MGAGGVGSFTLVLADALGVERLVLLLGALGSFALVLADALGVERLVLLLGSLKVPLRLVLLPKLLFEMLSETLVEILFAILPQ